jgi:hypothetical protein
VQWDPDFLTTLLVNVDDSRIGVGHQAFLGSNILGVAGGAPSWRRGPGIQSHRV